LRHELRVAVDLGLDEQRGRDGSVAVRDPEQRGRERLIVGILARRLELADRGAGVVALERDQPEEEVRARRRAATAARQVRQGRGGAGAVAGAIARSRGGQRRRVGGLGGLGGRTAQRREPIRRAPVRAVQGDRLAIRDRRGPEILGGERRVGDLGVGGAVGGIRRRDRLGWATAKIGDGDRRSEHEHAPS
jgi:hypothetical protein